MTPARMKWIHRAGAGRGNTPYGIATSDQTPPKWGSASTVKARHAQGHTDV